MSRADGEGRVGLSVTTEPPADLSIQERRNPHGMCYGCGPANPEGLRLRSFVEGADIVATVIVPAKMENGYGIVNGGIVTMVLDCHTAAVVLETVKGFDWEHHPPFLTARLDVSLRRPTPIETPLTVVGRLIERRSTELVVEAEIRRQDGEITASLIAGWRPVLRKL